MLNLSFKSFILQKAITYFFTDFNYQTQARWFKRCIYFLVLIHVAYWLRYYNLFFGQYAIALATPYEYGSFKDLPFILYNSNSVNLGSYFIIVAGFLAIMGLLLPYAYFFIDIILWFLVLNIFNRIYPTLTGGDFLFTQFLLFNSFLALRYDKTMTIANEIKRWLHNMSVIAIMTQMCVVYFISGITKLTDAQWLNGSAIGTISKIDHFSMYTTFREDHWGFLFLFLTYFVMLYQVAFPVLVWLPKVKKPFLIAGVLMHIYISFAMGLVMFGLVMIIGYIFLWPSDNSRYTKL